MRVLYDYQAFMQRQGGVSRYFVELIRALNAIPGFEARKPAPYSDNEYLEKKMTFLTRGHFKGKERIMGELNRIQAGRALKEPFDVFHPTYYRPYFLRRLDRPFVLTVHDMTHEIFGGEHVRNDGTSGNKRALCARAARIIAVSHSTKNDLCRLLDVPPDKVVVIHHATNMSYQGEPRAHERPYLLYVGARSGYKNFTLFLEAASGIVRQRGIDIVCVGGGIMMHSETQAIRSVGLEGTVHHIASCPPEKLASLYHFASLFCYPTLYEGFGLPLIEAFACGCPVAASATSSIPEVAGDAAELFNPESSASIAAAIERVLSSTAHASRLVAAGTSRLRSFSWELAARRTYETYCEAL